MLPKNEAALAVCAALIVGLSSGWLLGNIKPKSMYPGVKIRHKLDSKWRGVLLNFKDAETGNCVIYDGKVFTYCDQKLLAWEAD